MGKRRTWPRWTRPAPSHAAPSGPQRWRRAAGRPAPARRRGQRGEEDNSDENRSNENRSNEEEVEREQVTSLTSVHLALGGDISSWVESHGITLHCPVRVGARPQSAWSGAFSTFWATFLLLGVPTSWCLANNSLRKTSPRWTNCTRKRQSRPERPGSCVRAAGDPILSPQITRRDGGLRPRTGGGRPRRTPVRHLTPSPAGAGSGPRHSSGPDDRRNRCRTGHERPHGQGSHHPHPDQTPAATNPRQIALLAHDAGLA